MGAGRDRSGSRPGPRPGCSGRRSSSRARHGAPGRAAAPRRGAQCFAYGTPLMAIYVGSALALRRLDQAEGPLPEATALVARAVRPGPRHRLGRDRADMCSTSIYSDEARRLIDSPRPLAGEDLGGRAGHEDRGVVGRPFELEVAAGQVGEERRGRSGRSARRRRRRRRRRCRRPG